MDPGGVRKHSPGFILLLGSEAVQMEGSEGEGVVPGVPPNGTTRVVVAAVIERDHYYLIALRPEEKRHGGLWEFPGGKLDPGETLLEAAQRELQEELGIEVESIGATLRIVHDPGSEFAIHFVEVHTSDSPVPLEHTELRWCSREELRGMRLAPADALFVESLT